MKRTIFYISLILSILVLSLVGITVFIYFNRDEISINGDDYQPIPEISADELISMEEDPIASIKQNTEYYSQFTEEELDNAKVYHDMKKVENAIFVYNYVDTDSIDELPSWVSSDVVREYSSTYDGFVMDDFMSACLQAIIKCCDKYDVDLSDINMRCSDTGDIVFTLNNIEYYLYMANDLPNKEYKYTVYVIPVES